MIFFKSLRERVKLLEYENQILIDRIKKLEDHTKPPCGIIKKFTFPNLIREDGWDVSYSTLRKKHRKYKPDFEDGF